MASLRSGFQRHKQFWLAYYAKGYSPADFWMPLGFLIAGLGQLFIQLPGSVEALFPDWLQYAWTVVMVIGGFSALAGGLGPVRYRWLAAKSIGLLCISLAAMTYAVALAFYNFPGSLCVTITYVCFSISFFRMRRPIEKRLRAERRGEEVP